MKSFPSGRSYAESSWKEEESLPEFDHFADVSKMVVNGILGSLAGNLGLVDDLLEVPPLGVTEQSL